MCNPPISPKIISWAEDSAAAPHSLYLELFILEDSSENLPFPLPKMESVSYSSFAKEVLFCQYNGPWDVSGES